MAAGNVSTSCKTETVFKKNILPEALGAIFSQQVHMYHEFCRHSRSTLDLTMNNVLEVESSMWAATIRSRLSKPWR